MEICRFLRWKGYGEDIDDAELAYIFGRNSVPYSCLRTCQPWGLDDGPAEPESCRPGRSCYGGVMRPDDDASDGPG